MAGERIDDLLDRIVARVQSLPTRADLAGPIALAFLIAAALAVALAAASLRI